MTKVLIATDKPFAAEAVTLIKEVLDNANFETVKLEGYTQKSELLSAIANVEAVIIRSDIIDSEVLAAANNLKIVVRAGAGYDNVDLEAATAKNVCVMNTPGQNANAVAELAFGMMLFNARNGFNGKSGVELKGKKLGIHAYGNVGQNMARIAQGFGMSVMAFDPYAVEKIKADNIELANTVEELYSACNYISLNIPATAQTKKSINFELLSKMPKPAILVNTARKEVINEEEMIQFMDARSDFKYLSDVAPDNSAIFEEKYKGRFIFTAKKMGAQTEEANVNAGVAAAKQIVDFINNKIETFRVNKK